MGRRDEIDASLAKHFAWSFVPADRPELAAEKVEAAAREAAASGDDPDEPVVDERGAEEFRAKARASCRPLAEAIAGAWACGDEDARVRLTKRLLVRAERLGVSLVGMSEWPAEAVRLLRLAVALGGVRAASSASVPPPSRRCCPSTPRGGRPARRGRALRRQGPGRCDLLRGRLDARRGRRRCPHGASGRRSRRGTDARGAGGRHRDHREVRGPRPRRGRAASGPAPAQLRRARPRPRGALHGRAVCRRSRGPRPRAARSRGPCPARGADRRGPRGGRANLRRRGPARPDARPAGRGGRGPARLDRRRARLDLARRRVGHRGARPGLPRDRRGHGGSLAQVCARLRSHQGGGRDAAPAQRDGRAPAAPRGERSLVRGPRRRAPAVAPALRAVVPVGVESLVGASLLAQKPSERFLARLRWCRAASSRPSAAWRAPC